ncbi:ABC transporter permease [Ammoniphilus resinae]|uniref:Transport permease protein n=1 Tax=Ammoniphilus resinae TaxID=861532 RepID=A0ABS4GMD5_9BACL|nr:ABC transporter permease [Ammoniphilus resinae]MBP1931442.1 ABC-2 type transport system permease protein [Ammoniphilus resinae]
MKGRERMGYSFIRFKSIIRKELLQIRRDPPSLAIAIVMPILMIFLFGYAVNTDVNHLPMGVWDQDKSSQSRELVQQFVNTEYYDYLYQIEGYEELQQSIDEGKVKVALVIPANYSTLLDTGKEAKLQLLIDGADPNTARTALANAQLLIQNKSTSIQLQKLEKQGLGPVEMPITLQSRVLYNPNMESLVFNIPALIGLIMQNVTAILTAFTLVREKERGTMEQLVVTPVRPLELIVGKLVPYIGIGMFSFCLVLLTGISWFGVPVKGSIILLVVLSLLFLITTLAIGILISTVSKTQLQAMQMSFAFILPSVLLSGFIFPRESMPMVVQWLGGAIPLTYFLEILRGIFLKGVSLHSLWDETLILSSFTVLICLVAILKFRKRID